MFNKSQLTAITLTFSGNSRMAVMLSLAVTSFGLVSTQILSLSRC